MSVWRKRALLAILALAVVGTVLFVLRQPMSVRILTPEEKLPIKVFGLGTVEARIVSKLAFPIGGTLSALMVDHGDKVLAGQLLARMDNAEQLARAGKAKAQRSSAEAAVKVAEAASRKASAVVAQRIQNNQRRKTLAERNAISAEAAEDAQLNEDIARSDLLVAQSDIDAAKARLDEARAQYELDLTVLTQHEMKAPFNAMVVSRAKELGSVMAPGEGLFTLVAVETVWIQAYVDEAMAGDIAVGLEAEIRLRSLPQTPFRGRVARVGIESDRVNEERKVFVSCLDCPANFHLGEQAEVLITTGTLERALMIPETLVAHFDGTTGTVWTLEHGLLNQRVVSFGKRALDGRLQIIGGLPAEAQVLGTRSDRLRVGREARSESAVGPK